MPKLIWKRTSAEDTFDLNGYRSVSENSIDGKTVLYEIYKYDIKDEDGGRINKTLCNHCRIALEMFIGYDHNIYDREQSKHINVGKFETMSEAKVVAQQLDDLLVG